MIFTRIINVYNTKLNIDSDNQLFEDCITNETNTSRNWENFSYVSWEIEWFGKIREHAPIIRQQMLTAVCENNQLTGPILTKPFRLATMWASSMSTFLLKRTKNELLNKSVPVMVITLIEMKIKAMCLQNRGIVRLQWGIHCEKTNQASVASRNSDVIFIDF